MSNSGEYLTKMMNLESLSKQELIELTGKKESTVSSWTRYYGATVPKFKELVLICQRLGISLDDFYNETIPNNLVSISNHIYKPYLLEDGSAFNWVFITDVLSNKHYKEVLAAYVNDMMQFKIMLSNALKGMTINPKEFNSLCLNLHIYFQGVDEFGCVVGLMCYEDVERYKCYLEQVKEEGEPTEPSEQCIIITPYSDYLFLSDNVPINIVENYIDSLLDSKLSGFMHSYVEKVDEESNYDKSNVILKALLKRKADVLDDKGNKDYELLYNLVRRLF